MKKGTEKSRIKEGLKSRQREKRWLKRKWEEKRRLLNEIYKPKPKPEEAEKIPWAKSESNIKKSWWQKLVGWIKLFIEKKL